MQINFSPGYTFNEINFYEWNVHFVFNILKGLTNAYARGAKENGAKIIEDFPIDKLVVDQDSKGYKTVKGVQSEKGYVRNALSMLFFT